MQPGAQTGDWWDWHHQRTADTTSNKSALVQGSISPQRGLGIDEDTEGQGAITDGSSTGSSNSSGSVNPASSSGDEPSESSAPTSETGGNHSAAGGSETDGSSSSSSSGSRSPVQSEQQQQSGVTPAAVSETILLGVSMKGGKVRPFPPSI